MSQNFEESPISDSKMMDISDTTTSQDSPVISPDDDEHHNNQPNESLLQANSKPNKNSYISTETKTNTTPITTVMPKPPRKIPAKPNKTASTHYDSLETTKLLDTAEHYPDKLDNRKVFCRKDDKDDADDSTVNNSNGAAYNNSTSTRNGLTLANSHPLMSPPAAPSYDDSDSDHDHQNFRSATAFNYPDVVPEREPLRLAQPRHQLQPSAKEVIILKSTLDVTGTAIIEKISPAASISDYQNSDDDESEPDISQYHATVTPLFQSVALVSNRDAASTANSDTTRIGQRKIALTSDFLSDVSSFDSISNHSFDDDADNNLVSASVSSSVFDDTGFNQGPAGGSAGGPGVGQNEELATPAGCGDDGELPFDVPIPQYTASEEARDSRNWQKITLPDGRTRDIDMKVIEPYKRVLSHGGYLSSGGHNAIVVFCACYLPDRSRADYHYVMDNLFLYVVKTLDQLITDDYVLVYLHGGSSRSNVPPFPWLKKCYQLLDRRLRKSLKNLFMVHPTFWLKSVVWMARPFISSKFWKKLVYVRTLNEMYHLVPVCVAAVPEKVKKYDLKHT